MLDVTPGCVPTIPIAATGAVTAKAAGAAGMPTGTAVAGEVAELAGTETVAGLSCVAERGTQAVTVVRGKRCSGAGGERIWPVKSNVQQ